jgi:hypothetical protein
VFPLSQILCCAGLAALLMSCNQPDFPKYAVLGTLRILTVVASTPEANPGDTVTFTPVLSDVDGQGRTINYSVQACIDPGVGVGVTPQCPSPDVSSIQTGTLTIAPGASQTYTGPVSTFTLTMPAAEAIFANRSAADQYNGVAYLVFYSISTTDGSRVDSFLRVNITSSAKTQKNQNPIITSVDLSDSPTTSIISMPTTTLDFRVTSPASSAETYQTMRNDGSFVTHTEDLITTWFISDGEFDFTRTIGNSENAWGPPQPKPANRGIVMLVVTRDERGGQTFQKIEMQ